MQVQSLGREDLLEKEMTTHSSILAWRISWTDQPGELQSMGSRRVGHDGSDRACKLGFEVRHCARQNTPSSLTL